MQKCWKIRLDISVMILYDKGVSKRKSFDGNEYLAAAELQQRFYRKLPADERRENQVQGIHPGAAY